MLKSKKIIKPSSSVSLIKATNKKVVIMGVKSMTRPFQARSKTGSTIAAISSGKDFRIRALNTMKSIASSTTVSMKQKQSGMRSR